MAACTPSTSTIFEEVTRTTVVPVNSRSISLVTEPAATLVSGYFTTVAGVRSAVRTTIVQPEEVSTVFLTVTSLETSTIVTSTPVSLVVASCTETSASTTTTTSSTTTTTSATTTTTRPAVTTTTPSATSTTPSTTAAPSTTTPGRSTITQVTTVPFSSSSAPSSSATLAAATNRAANVPVGAIAGGVVGGVAVIVIGIFLIWYFGRKSKKEEDWDPRRDDAWDPALGLAGGKRHSGARRHSRGMSGSRHGGSGGGAMAMTGLGGAVAGAGWGSQEERNRRSRPADQQDGYYAALPPQSRNNSSTAHSTSSAHGDPFAGGMAGVGAAGMAGVGAMNRRQSEGLPYTPQQQRRGSAQMDDVYGGLQDELSGRDEGGWGVASRMHQPHGSPSRSNPASAGPSRSPTTHRVPVPATDPFASPPLPQQQQHYTSSAPHHPPSPQPPTSIPYRLPSPELQQGAPSGGIGFDPSAPMAASPALSHMSMPALGAVWNNGGSEVGEESRRSGQLRVVNDDEPGLSEEERRFGASLSGDAYGGLTEGLDRHKSL